MNLDKIKNIAELGTLYDENAANNNCITIDGKKISNEEFSENIINNAKRFLSLKLKKGDKVAILLINSIEYM